MWKKDHIRDCSDWQWIERRSPDIEKATSKGRLDLYELSLHGENRSRVLRDEVLDWLHDQGSTLADIEDDVRVIDVLKRFDVVGRVIPISIVGILQMDWRRE